MTSAELEQSHQNLQQESALQPKRRSSRLLFSLLLTGLGGFFGGMLTSYGPSYLNIYLTQPVLAHHGDSEVVAVSEVVPPVAPALETPAETPESLALKGGQARLVVQSHDRSYLVLQSDVQPGWGQGRIESRAAKDGFIFTLTQGTQSSALPTELVAYQEREFVLHDAQGYVCTASVGPLKLLQQGASDFYDQPNEKQDWDEYGGGPLLVAQLTPVRGTCKNALWARDASLPPASIARLSSATRALKKEARSAFRATEVYKALQTDFESQGGSGRWDLVDTQSLTFAEIKSAEEELVFVGSQFGGCGEFEAQLGMVFRRTESGSLELIKQGEGLMLGVDAAADIDGDGDLDLITSGDGYDRSLMLQTDGLVEETHSTVNIYYCRC